MDELYMARALELARRGRFTTMPNPNVGCVIVRDGEVAGEGWHQRAGEPHAEVHALRMAGEKARGATAYVTLEPCSHHGRTPPCCDALIAAGVSRVVAAMQDPNPQVAGRGLHRLHQSGIAVSHGLMMPEAEALNRGFLKRMRTGFPWIQLKLGASLDGRTAMASGESQWITSAAARRDVQRLRAQSAAILSSSATVLADDPSLTVRWSELDPESQSLLDEQQLRQPVRVIVDSQNRVTPQHRLISQPGETWLMRHQPDQQHWPAEVTQIAVPLREQQLDLVAMMMLLGQKQINSVWVEAGASLAGALLQAGLVDELIVYLAPKLLGHEGRGLCQLPGLSSLADAPAFRFSDVRQVGDDLRLTLTPQ
ncbi:MULTISPECIES: bifunctional diaminohydroxyphosphoribosylaminopyrimidine deaminase/5-amino-6-(5-phosphoribosylamino)uracil reductase RibD [Pantoea]|jgi:diaminohydroxyphosphoribosylaminopyrimidine deaminase/5-amino-6-(5-phosphoribosylamino)uracil reductase|uniref:bifunctional diaminohydroxyphosphoribosylaminopyrimidine deaminase/5-amino-6-(5-phosphoribosylamino)uracil reductase RibD n=1 Tax=Pantoea TaxID=53335 RepID=UPI0002A69749|nr:MULTISPECIES: bifunctional diaminohydroxyphosphoribosylaminopyrimidine deaminase/5-amino-6-(5-phosphoribosylamino)uracil reductase RibD [Pantoea]PQL28933.1 bifunctional diaminohydroxyphosphoribosylaminopyrimidine deaminase/5-amino-6-(5-phosphoribosylamino)uracil reductase RibD [Pantoea ananatis]AWP33797.1 bifunctional diaminohydroxyphosphoribosylaminopyrimidine deaminase/5-amino-6-(5-phosphoribosylamino)uracil reductase [Pantoea vagans]ELP24499.1 Diaminohydroxyphosphoribosylaminopyrimidine de